MSLRRAITNMLSTALITGAILAGTFQPASAASTGFAACSAESCYGQDPVTSGCDVGAYIVLQGAAFGSAANLWWSPSCQANWLQYDVPDSHHLYGLVLWGSAGDMSAFQTKSPGWAWTDMVASPGAATMCIDRYDQSGGSQQQGGCWTQPS